MRLLAISVVMAALAPSQAVACMAEPVSQALIYASKPADVPVGSTVIKAKIMSIPKSSWSAKLLVLEGPLALTGKKIWVTPTFLSSCITFGRKEGYVAIKPDGDPDDEGKYLAEVYNRSWWDQLIDWFGADPYFHPGSRAAGF